MVIYHSHTADRGLPVASSTSAIAHGIPEAHHVLVGMQDPTSPGRHDVRSYRTWTATVVERACRGVVEVVESYMFAHTGADAVPPKG